MISKVATLCCSYGLFDIIFYANSGKEYAVIIISTSEPTNTDGSPWNLTQTICDPLIFNTVASRAKYCVVVVGNPFVLLAKEKHLMKKYEKRAKFWTPFLRTCLQHHSLRSDHLRKDSPESHDMCMSLLKSYLDSDEAGMSIGCIRYIKSAKVQAISSSILTLKVTCCLAATEGRMPKMSITTMLPKLRVS